MQINSHVLKFQGTADLPEALEYGKQYKITVNGEVRGADPRPNDDGTSDITYPVRLINAELVDETGRVIPAKGKGTQSRTMRWRIIQWGREYFPELDEDILYQKMMGALLHEDRLERILDRLKPLVE